MSVKTHKTDLTIKYVADYRILTKLLWQQPFVNRDMMPVHMFEVSSFVRLSTGLQNPRGESPDTPNLRQHYINWQVRG